MPIILGLPNQNSVTMEDIPIEESKLKLFSTSLN